MNPEQKAREALVTGLRKLAEDGVKDFPRYTAVLMRQAANEIEDLGKYAEAIALLQDIREHGLRTDMHPTTTDSNRLGTYTGLCEYFGVAEKKLIARVRAVIGG